MRGRCKAAEFRRFSRKCVHAALTEFFLTCSLISLFGFASIRRLQKGCIDASL